MEKRLFLAIALSLLVLVGGSLITKKLYPVENKDVITKDVPQAVSPAPVVPVAQASESEQHNLENSTLSTLTFAKHTVIFIDDLAAIKEVDFTDYKNYKLKLFNGYFLGDEKLKYQKKLQTEDSIIYEAEDVLKRVTKKFIFSNNNYSMRLEIKIQNLTKNPIDLKLPLILGSLDLNNSKQAQFQEASIYSDNKTIRNNGRKDVFVEQGQFIALRDQYFCAILQPDKNVQTENAFIKQIGHLNTKIGLMSNWTIPANGVVESRVDAYIGPQDVKMLNATKSAWSMVIHYGFFDVISQILLQVLGFIHGLVRNWGLAIILLSILVYLVLFPLSLKQMRSMKEMQILQPKIEALRSAYKDNPQRLNKEIMELYREHKVNPFGGCLPLLLQMPIFFALYQALMRSVALKGAKFLWIQDLSEPDKLFILPQNLSFFGKEFPINILPIIMAIGMFFQQKLSMAKASGPAAEQQKIMVIVMPIMFGAIFYNMPSGLVLYWFVNSLLMLIFQVKLSGQK